jgi:fluoride exporter
LQDFLISLAWVAAGSAPGGLMRFFVSSVVTRAIGGTFPWGTIVVNATGAIAVGAIAAWFDSGHFVHWPAAWSLAVVGFLGSYTTVSTFSIQVLVLVREGGALRAAGNVLLTLALCLSGVLLGFVAAA